MRRRRAAAAALAPCGSQAEAPALHRDGGAAFAGLRSAHLCASLRAMPRSSSAGARPRETHCRARSARRVCSFTQAQSAFKVATSAGMWRSKSKAPSAGQDLDPAQALGQRFRRDPLDRYRNEALVQPLDFAELPAAPARLHRLLADQPHDGVGALDEVGELVLPLLAIRQVAAVDGDVEPFRLERGDERSVVSMSWRA